MAPAAEDADVRVIRLRDLRLPQAGLAESEVPASLPAWLYVYQPDERPDERPVTEAPAAYAVRAAAHADAVGDRLWPWSPYHRPPGPPLGEFIAAGAVAVRYPQPVPADAPRQLEAVAGFATGRAGPISLVAELREAALERWLRLAFGDRGAAEVVETLRFLRDAVIDEQAPAHLDLAIDRRALLEQASPWRYLEGAPFGGALAAARA